MNQTQTVQIYEEGCSTKSASVMEHLNWGYLQLGLVALGFGGLQVWWIGSTIRKQNLARPMREGEFSGSLERIWAKRQQDGQAGGRGLHCYLTRGAVQCSQRVLDAT